jgi:hypothetical protein
MEKRGPGRPKGQPRTGGRQKGTPNKLSGDLKEMILGALDDAGGRKYLAARAADTPGPFLTLLGKILPTVVDATHRQAPVEAMTIDQLWEIAGAAQPTRPHIDHTRRAENRRSPRTA